MPQPYPPLEQQQQHHLAPTLNTTSHRNLAPGETGHAETRDLSTFLSDMEYVLASRVQYQGRHLAQIQFRVDDDVSPGNILNLFQQAIRTLNLNSRPFLRFDIQAGFILNSDGAYRYFYPENNTSILPSLYTFVNAGSLVFLSRYLEAHPVRETVQAKIRLESKTKLESIPVLLFKFLY